VKILLEDDKLREKIVKNAREMVEKNYDWDLVAQKMDKLFNKLMA